MNRPLGYLIGRYPAASHAFLLREVEALRAAGLEVETISIRPPLGEELITEADRAAAESTYTVLRRDWPLKLLGAHLAALAAWPRRYFATLAYSFGLGRGPRGRLWQLFYFLEAIVVWRRCRRRDVGHIHTHFTDTATDSALLVSRFDPGLSFSITVHGPGEFEEAESNRLAEKLGSARFVVAVSEDAKARAKEVSHLSTATVVRLGVDLNRFSHVDRELERATRVLCLGRLVARKGQRDLLQAVARLDDVELTIAGEGPERVRLEALAASLGIEGRVTFTGVVGQDEALWLYREADIFCLPSLSEGLPVVLIEAMACSLPVVATRIDAIPELISDGRDGVLVEPGDAEELAAALGNLVSDPLLRRRLGAAARETVARLHDLEQQTARMAELFQSPVVGRAASA